MTHDQAWWAALAAALCSPSFPALIWKGWYALNALFPSIQKILAITGTAIVIAEDALSSGTGDQKKAKVIADVQAKLPAVAGELGIPAWAVAVFTNAGVLGFLIDSLVSMANAGGHLPVPGPAVPQAEPAG